MQHKVLGLYYDKSILKGFGGVENYALFLYEELSSKHDIIFICDRFNKYVFYERNGKEIKSNYRIDLIINLSGIDPQKTYKLCAEFGTIPIITVLHMDPGDIIFRISSKLRLRSNFFINLFSLIFKKTSNLRRSSRLFKSNYKNSFLTLVIAEEYINKFCALNGIKENEKESIDFILNPLINLKKNDKVTNFEDDNLKIVWAGRNNRQKRPDLAHKFCQLIEKELNYSFTVYTDEEGFYGKFKNSHFKRCKVNPPYKDSRQLKNYNVLLLTSDFEGYPLVIIEALSLGLWVICRDSFGAAKSLLNSKELGIVYPYHYCMKQVLDLIKENKSVILDPHNIEKRKNYSESKFDKNKHIEKLLRFSNVH